ncbi:MAG TPA: hypothetical protein VFQ44_27570 [Streptosporangiaceae bacterium]|nr:hypothetical protein [Streptosporangiaceae bacterium]
MGPVGSSLTVAVQLGGRRPGSFVDPATREEAEDHDRGTAQLARHKPGRLTGDDPDGCHRVQCPAAMSKIRCPLRPASMTPDRNRPDIPQPPEHPQPRCGTRNTGTPGTSREHTTNLQMTTHAHQLTAATSAMRLLLALALALDHQAARGSDASVQP